jgi:hypothetical protein
MSEETIGRLKEEMKKEYDAGVSEGMKVVETIGWKELSRRARVKEWTDEEGGSHSSYEIDISGITLPQGVSDDFVEGFKAALLSAWQKVKGIG